MYVCNEWTQWMCFKAVPHRKPKERMAKKKRETLQLMNSINIMQSVGFFSVNYFVFRGSPWSLLLCLLLHVIDTFVQWSHRESTKNRIRHSFVIVTHFTEPSVSPLLATKMPICEKKTRTMYSWVASHDTWLKKVPPTTQPKWMDWTWLHLQIVYSASSSSFVHQFADQRSLAAQTHSNIHSSNGSFCVRCEHVRPKGLCEPLHVQFIDANAWTELCN